VPCIFCIAAFVMIAGAVSAGAVDKMAEDLGKVAEGPLRKLAETESVVKWELEVRLGRQLVPVAVTVYKEHGRVRIQILTHELSKKEAEELEDKLADVLGARVLSRSTEDEERKVHEASEADSQPEAERATVPQAKRERKAVEPTPRSQDN
jgi:hypothetical protein